ncbi:MAG TPA: hypothetical protein VFZ12_00425 [Dehalococcoidia bacterium]|nr:hypothetical protein [Dehalococcoidia bacterium]
MSWRVFAAAVSAIALAACGGDDRDPEEALRRDLDGLVSAFNDEDVGRLYDHFMALDCQELLSREEAEERFEERASNARLAIDEPLQIEITANTATVRTAISASADDEEESALDSFRMVFEEGHWRFVDCFGASDND